MKTLDSYGDDYRNAQLTILLEVKLIYLQITGHRLHNKMQPSNTEVIM